MTTVDQRGPLVKPRALPPGDAGVDPLPSLDRAGRAAWRGSLSLIKAQLRAGQHDLDPGQFASACRRFGVRPHKGARA